jgi:hypothetical protein
MGREETYFRPIWEEYYNRQGFDTVLYYEDTAEIAFNHERITREVEEVQRMLLKNHDIVVYTDADEILLRDGFDTLGEYCKFMYKASFNPTIAAVGYDLVEGKLVRVPMFDKPLITSVPLDYEYGYHRCKQPVFQDQSLRLIHLHRMNYNEALKRHQIRARWKWDAEAIAKGHSIQNQISEESKFKEWFYNDKDKQEAVPRWLKPKLALSPHICKELI